MMMYYHYPIRNQGIQIQYYVPPNDHHALQIDNYKVTAKSGSKAKDITSDYPISSILNSTSKKLTAVIGTSGTNKGDAKYTYKLTIPNISTANVKNNITGGTEKTVHLYCYGKSYYNG